MGTPDGELVDAALDGAVTLVPDAFLRADAGVVGLGGDAGPMDSGAPSGASGCRTETFVRGVRSSFTQSTHAPDGRLLRADSFREGRDGAVAWAEALDWDDAGRVTDIAWTDVRGESPVVSRREQRRYRSDGRLLQTVTSGEGRPTWTEEFRYEGEWLREIVVQEGDAESRSWVSFELNLAERELHVFMPHTENTVYWDVSGRPFRVRSEALAGETPSCRVTDILRDVEGFVLEQRYGGCGWPESSVTVTPFVYAESRTLARLVVGSNHLARRFDWSRDEDRVEIRGSRFDEEGVLRFAESTFSRHLGCRAAPNRRRPVLVRGAGLMIYWPWAAPIQDVEHWVERLEFAWRVQP